jgi:hypothetical protein
MTKASVTNWTGSCHFLPAADSISAVEKAKRLRELLKRVKEQPLSDFAATASAAADNQPKAHLTRVCGLSHV